MITIRDLDRVWLISVRLTELIKMVKQNRNTESGHLLIPNGTHYGSIQGDHQDVSDFEPEFQQHRYDQDFFSDAETDHPFSSNRATSPAPKSLVWLGYIFSILSGLCFISA